MESRNRERLFQGLVVDVEQLEVQVRGVWHPFQVVRHPGGVGVLPCHEDGTVTLVRQVRPPLAEPVLEIAAGRLSPGEEPETCGRRELREETGLTAVEMLPLGEIYSTPGFCDERIALFLAPSPGQGEPAPEEYEQIETVRLPLAQAVEMALYGEIRDAKTVVALLRAKERLP